MRWLSRLETLSGVLRWTLLVLAMFFSGMADVPRERAPHWVPTNLVEWVANNAFYLVPSLLVSVAVLQLLEYRVHRFQARRRLRVLLESVLERFRDRLLPTTLRADPPPHHRLTVFKANRRQSKLRIVARSAEPTRGSKTYWRIDPDDQSKCEGVAGAGWYLDSVITRPGSNESELPDVSGHCTAEEVLDYAKRTWCTPEQVRKHRWGARSFAALTIRVKGRRWGVLVLDSVSPQGASTRIRTMYQFAADILGDIIEQWSTK